MILLKNFFWDTVGPQIQKLGLKMGLKKTKGAVSLTDWKGRVRMRWRYESKRYSLTLFKSNRKGLLQAKRLALVIESDLFNDEFDVTLCKYRGIKPPEKIEQPIKSIVEHFEYWVSESTFT